MVAIDTHSAQLNFNYKDISTSFIVRFNEADEIKEMESTRYMTEEKREKWLCTMSKYKELNGVIVPTYAEAIWLLEKGDHAYAKFNMQKMEYNKAERF